MNCSEEVKYELFLSTPINLTEEKWYMTSSIVTDFQLSIKEGKLEDFKTFINHMIEVTDINEPDTLVYEWYINENGSECHLIEHFKSSEAFMTHLANVSHMFDTLFQFSTMTRAKIYGRPSDELKQSLDPLGAEYFDNFNGITR
jgi:quinol monooxygenase YgiN